jgi:hypothetical protein
VLVAPEQTAAAPIEAEAFEKKNVPRAERLHADVSHARQNFGRFLAEFRIFHRRLIADASGIGSCGPHSIRLKGGQR